MTKDKKTKETLPLIYGNMVNIMKNIGSISKDAKNKSQGFMFRGIDDVYNTLHSIMAKEGVFTTSKILDRTREERIAKSGSVLTYTVLRISYTFHAIDGSSVTTESEGEAMDSGDKSTGKAMSIADKYALLQCFKIPTKEEKDPDYQVSEPTVKQPAKITAALKEQLHEVFGMISRETTGAGFNSTMKEYSGILKEIREKYPQALTDDKDGNEGFTSLHDRIRAEIVDAAQKAKEAEKEDDPFNNPLPK